MEIDKLTIIELKALAYDCLVKIENAQKDLSVINAMISKKINEDKNIN